MAHMPSSNNINHMQLARQRAEIVMDLVPLMLYVVSYSDLGFQIQIFYIYDIFH